MTVNTYDPQQLVLSMTDKAIAHTLDQVAAQSAIGLRIGTKESGCSGYKYIVDLVKDEQAGDTVIQLNNALNIYVAPESIPLVNGMEIDYVTEGVNRFFKFNNPNAQGECGCGESFSVDAP